MSEEGQSRAERYPPLDRLRGMSDVAPADLERRRGVLERIQRVLRAYGYRAVETPIVEPTELFLRKSGGERVAQMYAFHYRDRDIALRPEHTASVLRMYADSMQSEPLPIRLSYAGPVFRYEKPQAGRTRQFTEVGCELLGAAGPSADAEVIHLALATVGAAGVSGRLTLGHIGIVLEFLDRLPLRQRARDWLIWSMERLRKGQPVDLDLDLAGLVSGDRLADLLDEMSDTLRGLPPAQLESWVLAVLREVGVQFHGGSRTPEEIVAGVLAKMNRHSDEEDVRHAFEFIRELVGIQGPPQTVLPEVRSLVQRHRLHGQPIEQIERTLDLLTAYGHQPDAIELNLGMGRGLHYYTGMLFEIYAADRPALQLCGGGRYDDLAQILGARHPLPACGFSCGLERLVQVAGQAGQVEPARVMVVPGSPEAEPAAIRVAERLRREGLIVHLEVRRRSLAAARRQARRSGIRRLVSVAPDGHARDVDLQPEPAIAGDGANA